MASVKVCLLLFPLGLIEGILNFRALRKKWTTKSFEPPVVPVGWAKTEINWMIKIHGKQSHFVLAISPPPRLFLKMFPVRRQ